MAWRKAEGLEDLWEGEMRACRVEGKPILVLMQEGAVRAYLDRCAHLGVPMSEGHFQRGLLICRAHAYVYDAATGQGVNPRNVHLQSYPAKREEGSVWIDLGEGT